MSALATKSVLCLSVALAMKDIELEAETLYKDEVRSIDTYSKPLLSTLLRYGQFYYPGS